MQSAFTNGDETVSKPTGLSLLAIANVLLRYRHVLLGAATAAAFAVAAVRLLTPRTYTVQSSFIIDNKDGSGAAGLAAQLGVDVGGIDVTKSPEFYVGLLKTPDVQGHLADTSFMTSKDKQPRRLAEIWEVKGSSSELQRERVIALLQQAITSVVGTKVDVVQLTVTTKDPLLSKELAEATLAQVNWFNLRTRQTRASAERRFTESRMNELRGELGVAEAAMQRFLEVNRQQYLSPALEVEKGRLERGVALAQSTYSQVAQAFEHARIDEVRDTPLITVIQQPRVPVRPDARGLVSKTILSFVLTLLLGSVAVILWEVMRWTRWSRDEEAMEFNRLVADASRDVYRLKGFLRRAPSSTRTDASLPS